MLRFMKPNVVRGMPRPQGTRQAGSSSPRKWNGVCLWVRTPLYETKRRFRGRSQWLRQTGSLSPRIVIGIRLWVHPPLYQTKVRKRPPPGRGNLEGDADLPWVETHATEGADGESPSRYQQKTPLGHSARRGWRWTMLDSNQ